MSTFLACTCGADEGDFLNHTERVNDCECAPTFMIALAIRHVGELSRLAGAISPSLSCGALTVIEDIIANHRDEALSSSLDGDE